jgi:hypothetical protein
MLAKKFALGFGIAIILPMLVHYGVSTFSPRPKWRDYYEAGYYQRIPNASPEEKAKLEQERKKRDDEFRNAQKRFQRYLFFAAVPIGIISIITGSITQVQAIGTGLMFGGIFTLVDGYCWYWSELQDWMRFLSLLIAFVILIFIGYRKLAK